MTPQEPRRPFHTASDAEIKGGEVYDVYFERTVQILKARGDRKRVKAEVYLKALPEDWEWGVLAGIEEAAALLQGVPVDVRAMDEGTIFAPYQPIMVLEGVYVDWAQYETALLGVLCQASGIATKAARCEHAAGAHRHAAGREVRGDPRGRGARRRSLRGAARHAVLAPRRSLSHRAGGALGARPARLRTREDHHLGRDRRVRDPAPQSRRRWLRR